MSDDQATDEEIKEIFEREEVDGASISESLSGQAVTDNQLDFIASRVKRANELFRIAGLIIRDMEDTDPVEVSIQQWESNLQDLHEREEADRQAFAKVVTEGEEIMEFLAAAGVCVEAAVELYEEAWNRIESENIDVDQLRKALDTVNRKISLRSPSRVRKREQKIFSERKELVNEVEKVLGPLEREILNRFSGEDREYLAERVESMPKRVKSEISNQSDRKKLVAQAERYVERREEQVRQKNSESMRWMQD